MMQNFGLEDLSHVQSRRNLLKYLVRVEMASDWFTRIYRSILAEQTGGAFHSTKNSGNSGFGSEWNRHFPEFHSEILGVPREVGLKFRKIGITGKFRSIRTVALR